MANIHALSNFNGVSNKEALLDSFKLISRPS